MAGKYVTCPDCACSAAGRGKFYCDRCGGSGVRSSPGRVRDPNSPDPQCSKCSGSGTVNCGKCLGTGSVWSDDDN